MLVARGQHLLSVGVEASHIACAGPEGCQLFETAMMSVNGGIDMIYGERAAERAAERAVRRWGSPLERCQRESGRVLSIPFGFAEKSSEDFSMAQAPPPFRCFLLSLCPHSSFPCSPNRSNSSYCHEWTPKILFYSCLHCRHTGDSWV